MLGERKGDTPFRTDTGVAFSFYLVWSEAVDSVMAHLSVPEGLPLVNPVQEARYRAQRGAQPDARGHGSPHRYTSPGRGCPLHIADDPQRAMTMSTAGLAKGQYQIEITDVDGRVHKGRFGI